jgi:hypothetical protein
VLAIIGMILLAQQKADRLKIVSSGLLLRFKQGQGYSRKELTLVKKRFTVVKTMNTKISKNTAQQGDVILRKINTLPVGNKNTISTKKCTLAEGESTGHAHVIDDDESEMFSIGTQTFLTLGKPATIKHEEHKPITLDKGTWEVGRVQEYDYFKRMVNSVKD